ncbi:MAG: hypothetical protein ABIT16_01815 [Croceibacterium sp.]
MTTEGQMDGIRYGRALLGAVIVEVLLGVVAVPILYLSANPAPALNLAIPPASFVLAMLVVTWLFARSGRPVANGVATGLMSIMLYVVLGAVAYLVAPEQANLSQSLSLPYLAAHVLKVLGGGFGGYLIARKASPAA